MIYTEVACVELNILSEAQNQPFIYLFIYIFLQKCLLLTT